MAKYKPIQRLPPKDETRVPERLVSRQFRRRLAGPWFAGTYLWFVVSIVSSAGIRVNSRPAVHWLYVTSDHAYLWLTANVVLILALAASSSLDMERSPKLGQARYDATLAIYDAARLSATRRRLRFGAYLSAGITTIVSWMGAADYIYEIDWSKAGGPARQGAVAGAVLIVLLGLMIVFTSATLSLSLWVSPRGLSGETRDLYPRAKVALRAVRAPSRLGFLGKWSLPLAALFGGVVDASVYKLVRHAVSFPQLCYLFVNFAMVTSIILGIWEICYLLVFLLIARKRGNFIKSWRKIRKIRVYLMLLGATVISFFLYSSVRSFGGPALILMTGVAGFICILTSFKSIFGRPVHLGIRASMLSMLIAWSNLTEDTPIEELKAKSLKGGRQILL